MVQAVKAKQQSKAIYIDWDDWLNREHITLDDALLLSMEENPDSHGINQDYDETKYIELRDKAEHWILINLELQAIGELNNGSQEFKNINSLSFFKLARLNGWFLPKPVNDFLDMRQKQQSVTWSGDIQALEPLTAEQRQTYNKLAAWTWVDAIYILQGFKPCPQISTEQVRSHFPGEVNFFTQSIQLGNIGKKITQAEERTFIDSPAKWETFWQGIDKPKAEPQTEAVGDGGAVASLIPAQNDLKKRTKVLQDWLVTQKEYKPGEVFVLPKGINHKSIQITLNNESEDKMLFDLTLDSFKRHFWQEQKIAALKRGR